MKIIFAIKAMESTKGGAERVLADVTAGLADMGHEITLVTYDSAGGGSFYPLSDKIVRKSLTIGNSNKRAKFGETIRRMIHLRRYIKSQRPDIVVAFMHSMFVPMAFALAGTRIPVVGSEHIVPEHYKDRKLEYILLYFSTFFLRKITVLSSAILKKYPRNVREKMVVIGNPVHMSVSSELPAQRQSVILNVGRLEPQKDQVTLIRAFAKIANSHPDWKVRIVGEGALRPVLESEIAVLGMQDRIILAGTTKNIAKEYQGASIFALPSRYESFGLATAEAMAYELPAVGFADCPGTNELVIHGKNGLLVEGDDRVLAFAVSLETLMRSPDMRAEMGVNGRESVRQYAPEGVVQKWNDLLIRVFQR